MKRTLLAAITLCSACGHTSPPTRYYTLAALAAAAPTPYAGPPVRLEAVHLPPSVAGRPMLHTTSEHQVEIRNLERWSDNLDYLLRQTLAQDLLTRLPEGALIFPDAPRPRGALSWVVDVLAISDQDGELRCEVSWSLLSSEAPQAVERRQRAFSAKADGSPEAIASALSQVARDIADAMVASLQASSTALGAAGTSQSPSGT